MKPALFTMMSMVPKVDIAADTTLEGKSERVTSPLGTRRHVPEEFRIKSAVA